MTYGGIAHGIGAALYEKFSYTEDGQLASGSFMDYYCRARWKCRRSRSSITARRLRAHDVRAERLGGSRLSGAPAAIANAVNDALAPLAARIDTLPITHDGLWQVIQSARQKETP